MCGKTKTKQKIHFKELQAIVRRNLKTAYKTAKWDDIWEEKKNSLFISDL